MTQRRDSLRQRIEAAAIVSCNDHYEQEHVNTIPPCAGAIRDAQWWAVALGLGTWEEIKDG